MRRGAFCVWQRNFLYFRYTLVVSILWVVIEPLLFLYAIGYGLGTYVGEIHGMSYAEFFFPALMMVSAMTVAFYETTYSSYTKLTRQKTFHAILLTPIMPSDIGLGEILWAASKGLMSATGVAVAASLHGLVGSWAILPTLAISFLLAWVFSAFGLLITTYARSYDWFIYAQTGVVVPIYFFSGTYFPIDSLPAIIQKCVWLSPLFHGLRSARMILAGDWDWIILIHLSFLLVIAWIITHWSVRRLYDHLIQ
jgi:lipooligosaccharide transport system permease protein